VRSRKSHAFDYSRYVLNIWFINRKEGQIVYSFGFVERDCASNVWIDWLRHRADTDTRADSTAGSNHRCRNGNAATDDRDAIAAAANPGSSNSSAYADRCIRASDADARRRGQHAAPCRDAHAHATRCRANRNFAPDQVRRAKIIESQL